MTTDNTNQSTVPARVEINERQFPGDEKAMLVVEPVWAGVDRPNTGGWAVKDMKMARRLERALMAGAAISSAEVRTDVAGQTYMSTTSRVLGRMMNADLKRLGF